MQIVENWTCVTGIVLAVSQPVTDARLKIEMQIESTEEVKGFPSLLPERPGDRISIKMPENFITEEKEIHEKRITLPVRMVRAGVYFADTDWSLQGGSKRCKAR